MLLEYFGRELRQMLDPRLQLVTITSVKMSADLRRARVFWTMLGEPASVSTSNGSVNELTFPTADRIRELEQVLNKAASHFRRGIGSQLSLRYTPEILFEYDASLREGFRIDRLLDEISR